MSAATTSSGTTSSRRLVLLLVLALATLATGASGVGLFASGGDGPRTFVSVHGVETTLYGRGLYSFDTAFKAPILRGTDLVVLIPGVPFLLAALRRALRGSARGELLLAGALTFFLYQAVSVIFGATYNDLYLVYVAMLSTSFWALFAVLHELDLDGLEARMSAAGASRGVAIFLFVSALSPLVWLVEILAGLASGEVPRSLGSYSTDVTTALDVGLITPACVTAGVLVLRKRALGYLVAVLLLVLLVFVGLAVTGQTAMQLVDGVALTPAQILTYVVPFLGLSLAAVHFLRRALDVLAPEQP